MTDLNASIVLYRTPEPLLRKAIDSFLGGDLDVHLYLVDNSPDDRLRALADGDTRVSYIFNDANIGFGAGHNIALRASLEADTAYHVVMNPDAWFSPDILPRLLDYMRAQPEVGNLMPRIRFGDGTEQPHGRLLPTPFNLIVRRLLPAPLRHALGFNSGYELRFWSASQTANLPCLCGCFMLLRVSSLRKVGLFDENIFMYLEDYDLNRRIHEHYQTVFYPRESVFHEYARGSASNLKLLMIHLRSALYYFNKWGWLFDRNRRAVNRRTVHALRALDAGAGKSADEQA